MLTILIGAAELYLIIGGLIVGACWLHFGRPRLIEFLVVMFAWPWLVWPTKAD